MNTKLQKIKLQTKVLVRFENKTKDFISGLPTDPTTGTITLTGTGMMLSVGKKKIA